MAKKNKLATYDNKDFWHNWDEINENLAERWDSVIKFNPHHELKNKVLTDDYIIKALIKRLDKWLPKGKKLKFLKYDLYNEATGTAELTKWILDQGYEFYGVDISKEVVKKAKENFKKVTNVDNFVIGDVRSLPFKDNTFDVVFSYGTIEHIRENQEACDEAFRVLKPGGYFYTGVNNRLDMWGSYFVNEATAKIFKDMTSYEPSFFPWEERGWLKKAGFVNVRTSGTLMFPHLIRYTDLFMEWKELRGVPRWMWNNLVIKPFIKLAEVMDEVDLIRLFGTHTTSMGYKPKRT